MSVRKLIDHLVGHGRNAKPADSPSSPAPEEDWLHKTCRELGIPTDDVGSVPLMIPYKPVGPACLNDEERRRREDDYRHWRQRPQGMWDRRG
jgi:hypothetical protein